MKQNSLNENKEFRQNSNNGVVAEQNNAARRKYRILMIVVTVILIAALAAFFVNRFGDASSKEQLDWSDWLDELPKYATDDKYDIEEQAMYRSRSLETTESTERSTMQGWELYDTVEGGEWTDWSATAAAATDTKEVETQTRYRYRNKETTSSSNSNMQEWVLYDTTKSWGDYGSWSNWSTSPAYSSNSRKVETKTQYRYRNVSYSTEYTGWGSWSSWSFDRQNTSELKKEESRTVWGYAYFLCPYCGAHMHGYGECWTWAYGCGRPTTASGWHEVWSTIPWSQAGLKDWFGTGKYYTYINGELVFKWPEGGSKTQYRYSTRSTQRVPSYGNWSTWGDTYYYDSPMREVQTRTVYRFCDRKQVPTYHFYRWGNWSDWSVDAVSASDNRQVESTLYYRYKDKGAGTTYYFKRWGEWSEYSPNYLPESDTVDVETKTMYRYKLK